MKGIDVSRWQGDIDWKKVKQVGIQFAIIKAGGSDKGFYKDSKFEQNYAGAKANGIAVGSYYFVGKGCTSAADGLADAKRFEELLKGKQFEMPVYMDNEAQPASAKAGITDATIAFCDYLESKGFCVGVYGSKTSGFQDRMIDGKLQKYTHWVAQYSSKCTYPNTSVLGMWQYSSTGRVDGINGNVDLDICYVNFPEVIKKKSLNGFINKDWTYNAPARTIEERVTDLEKRVDNIEKKGV